MERDFDRRALLAGAAIAAGLSASATSAAAADAKSIMAGTIDKPKQHADVSPANVYTINANDEVAYGESAISQAEANLGLAVADDDFKVWMTLLHRFNRFYQLDKLSDDDDLVDGFRHTALAVDAKFEYSNSIAEGNFNYFHVETLLNQTADLLDRCIQEREKFEEESTRAARLALEVKEFLTNDSILRGMIRDGLFKLPAEFAVADRLSLANQQMYWTIAHQHHTDAAQAIDPIGQYNNARFLAWLQYITDEEKVTPKINGVPASRSEHAQALAGNQAAGSAQAQSSANSAQAEESLERLQTSHQTYANLLAKEKWERTNKQYKHSQVRQARELARTKMVLCTLDGGALNFAERRDHSKARFERDFNDALSRLASLAMGMSLLYGYSLSKGSGQSAENELESVKELVMANEFGKLDLITNQVRDSIAWLIRFQGAEQTYKYSVSLRNLLNPDLWNQGLKNNGIWKLTISEELFPDQFHMRLRGVYVFTSSTGVGIWRCSLRCDPNSTIRWLDGTVVQLDQSRIPKFLFGRVSDRESVRAPESGNVLAAHNVSPLGTWTVEVSSAQGADLLTLQDVEVVFEVAVRTK